MILVYAAKPWLGQSLLKQQQLSKYQFASTEGGCQIVEFVKEGVDEAGLGE